LKDLGQIMDRRSFLVGAVITPLLAPVRIHLPTRSDLKLLKLHLLDENGYSLDPALHHGYSPVEIKMDLARTENGCSYSQNSNEIIFPQAKDDWGLVGFVAISDSFERLVTVPLIAEKHIYTGDTIKFSPGMLRVTCS
jgi:hypothetical protein